MKITCLVLLCCCQFHSFAQQALPLLKVSSNGHTLVIPEPNGREKPFFWLGDTAWELFEGLDRQEAARYLDDRKLKKFTVIQAHLLTWEFKDLNAYGEKVFKDDNFDSPNEKYWQHVDYIMEEATRRGLYMALLPAWAAGYIEPGGSALHSDSLKAYRYARFLGARYKKYRNVIWVLGGDKRPGKKEIYRHLAKGLTETYADNEPENILMTYHPPGGTNRPPATSSGEFFHNENWMDFNMIQSGHALENASYDRIREDYNRTPIKPTLDAEPCYEQHPVKHNFKNGAFEAWHLRRRGYWSVLAGACGFTYGANGIWQMDKPGRISLKTHQKDYWHNALNYEGASQMRYLRGFAEQMQWQNWVPDTTLLAGNPGRVDDRIQSVRSADGNQMIFYTTNGRQIDTDVAFKGKWRYHWYDPRTGKKDNWKRVKGTSFASPEFGPGRDWLLVISKSK